SALGAVMLLAAISQTAYGWHLVARVRCPSDRGIQNITINVTGTTCLGAFNESFESDVDGNYFLNLPDCAGSFTACLDMSDLPAGATLAGPACVPFTTSDDNQAPIVTWIVNTTICPPPPLLACIGD